MATKEELKQSMGLKPEKVNLFKKKTTRESKTDRNERLFMQPVLEERGRKENKKRDAVKKQKRDSSGQRSYNSYNNSANAYEEAQRTIQQRV